MYLSYAEMWRDITFPYNSLMNCMDLQEKLLLYNVNSE